MQVIFIVMDYIKEKPIYIKQQRYKEEDVQQIGICMKQLQKQYRNVYVLAKMM